MGGYSFRPIVIAVICLALRALLRRTRYALTTDNLRAYGVPKEKSPTQLRVGLS